MKTCMFKAMDSLGFGESGANITIMRQREAWIGHAFVKTSHPRLARLVATTPTSSLMSWQHIFKKAESGRPLNLSRCLDITRRFAVFDNLCQTTFARLGIAQQAQAQVWELVEGGGYDADLDGIAQANEEHLPMHVKDFDEYLIESSSVVQGVMEASQHFAEHGSASGSGSAEGSGSAIGSGSPAASATEAASEEFLQAMEEDVLTFEAFVQERAGTCVALSEAEAKYVAGMSVDAEQVAKSFADKYAPMMPFKADYKPVLTNLQKTIEDRLSQVVDHCGCHADDILRVISNVAKCMKRFAICSFQ